MHLRSSSAELGSFFFQPLDFHLQPTDLLVQLSLLTSCVSPRFYHTEEVAYVELLVSWLSRDAGKPPRQREACRLRPR